MSPDEYREECRNRCYEPSCETLAALTERQEILDFIHRNLDQSASELARRIADGAHEP